MDASKRSKFKADRRKWEFQLIVAAIKETVPKALHGKLRILEYGCGPSGGAEYLCEIGDLIVSDIYQHTKLSLPPQVRFEIADIHKTDFKDHEFDLLVSNQVIEHLCVEVAFQEMLRITKPEGYFAFAIPTATWLVLSIPGQIVKKVENVIDRIRSKVFNQPSEVDLDEQNIQLALSKESVPNELTLRKRTWLKRISLEGHGCYPRFMECFRSFRVKTWRNLLIENGFSIVSTAPLLTYGSSHFPMFPANHFMARHGFSSSYLFICKNATFERSQHAL